MTDSPSLPYQVEHLNWLVRDLSTQETTKARLVIADEINALLTEMQARTANLRGDLALELRDEQVPLEEIAALLSAADSPNHPKGGSLSIGRLQAILTDARRRNGRPPAPPGRPRRAPKSTQD